MPRQQPVAPPAYFDAAYFRRWYGNPTSRAFTRVDKEKRADFVLSYLRLLGVPVKRVCDVGCGLGHWRDALVSRRPRLSYTGVEISPFLCQRFGWHQASAADYAPKRQFDLVIAQSVLHHLNARDCAQAIRNIASYCRGALYLEVATARDWKTVIDRTRTDPAVYHRTGTWYKAQLARHFVSVGGGLFLAKRAGVALLELERG